MCTRRSTIPRSDTSVCGITIQRVIRVVLIPPCLGTGPHERCHAVRRSMQRLRSRPSHSPTLNQPRDQLRTRDVAIEEATTARIHGRRRAPAAEEALQRTREARSRYPRRQEGTPGFAPADFDVRGFDMINFTHMDVCTSCEPPRHSIRARIRNTIHVGTESQLFIDEHLVSTKRALERIPENPKKTLLHPLAAPRRRDGGALPTLMVV